MLSILLSFYKKHTETQTTCIFEQLMNWLTQIDQKQPTDVQEDNVDILQTTMVNNGLNGNYFV